MFPVPPLPSFPPGQFAVTHTAMRYEDVTQDGRLVPLAIPPSLGGLWSAAIARHPGARSALAHGIIPILTRMTIVSLDHQVRADGDLEAHAGFELAHDRSGDEVTRLFLNAWSEVRGVAGTLGPTRPTGERVPAGRLFAEHTFTRLFAPPGQRRVTRFGVEGLPDVPETRYPAPAAETAQEAPAGGRWLDELAPDPTEVCFTLDQTDSNQHVNSLVYIRLFLDAVSRRLAAAGEPLKVRSRAIDIAYKKPCFAGDRVRVHLRRFEHEGSPGAAGVVAAADGKPRCFVRVLLGA